MSSHYSSRLFSQNESSSMASASTLPEESSESLTTTRDRSSVISRDFENSITDSLLTTMTTTDASSIQVVTKDMINKKQLQHDLELARIELNQKNLMIDSMKAEYLSKIDELEEKVADTVHQKQLLTAQFQNRFRITQEGLKKENETLKNEIGNLLKLQKSMNKDKEKLMEKAMGSKEGFENLDIDEDEYHDIKGKPVEDKTLWEFIAVKFYEAIKPLNIQCNAVQSRIELYVLEVNEKEDEIARKAKELEEERAGRIELDIRCQKLQVNLDELRDQLKRKDYKNENFDTLRSERDQLERELMEVRKICTINQGHLETKTSEIENMQNELIGLRQSVVLLKQDKSYLTKEIQDVKPRHDLLEEKLRETSKLLDDARSAKEEYYERYIASRDRCKLEYEERLRHEINGISKKTSVEIEKIKTSSHEMFERENRALKEARDGALAEKQRLDLTAKEAENRYRDLLSEFRQLQLSSESKMAEAYNEFKLKSFELERLQLVFEEGNKNLKKCNLENAKLSRQKEELYKEYNNLQLSTNKRITELESRDLEMSRKLTTYEKMEDELDSVIMQAAELSDDHHAERVLFSYGYGANIPSTAKRRMQQSVHLAKRVLQLERVNSSLKNEHENEKKRNSQLSKELSATSSLLSEAKQPYNCLIDSIKIRDDENKRMKDAMNSLNDDISRLRTENTSLAKLNDQMTLDLERLLNQKEEMNVLKQAVLGMSSSSANERLQNESSQLFKRKTAIMNRSEKDDSPNIIGEKSIVISETPSWYNKLKAQNRKAPTGR